MNNTSGYPKIVVAGASGYIGKAVLPKLLEKFPQAEITALSRSQQTSTDPRIKWKACDLFSLKSLEETIPPETDLALYLVHSMGPTAQLDQGSFADYDLILADNFARALKATKIQQLIYLGGLTPDSTHLSLHLQSRLEVEQTFAQYDLLTTVFRAGLILGDAGSSFQILLKLVKRLPIMICPRWTQNLTSPVDLATVLDSIAKASLAPEHIHKVYDLAGCEALTYVDMMRGTARRMGKKRYFITVPFFTPTLSRLWVSLITGTSKGLVYPLVASLEHVMVARPTHLFSAAGAHLKYYDLLASTKLQTPKVKAALRYRAQRRTVRSVQRLPLPEGRNAEWVKDQYLTWLPRVLAPLISVRVDDRRVGFSVAKSQVILLDLTLNRERSNPGRQLLYITGGVLTSGDNKGRLEFREVLNRRYVLAAIHDFKPALSWYFYKYSQATIHLVVMKCFANYLKSEMRSRSRK